MTDLEEFDVGIGGAGMSWMGLVERCQKSFPASGFKHCVLNCICQLYPAVGIGVLVHPCRERERVSMRSDAVNDVE